MTFGTVKASISLHDTLMRNILRWQIFLLCSFSFVTEKMKIQNQKV